MQLLVLMTKMLVYQLFSRYRDRFTKLGVPAVLWGAAHEEDGFALYSNLYVKNHQQPSCIATGHRIGPE
ncbi:hypothetical protein KUTeg_012723 [Tegillarca granosa]|uniref:Uncharacterized protein n=1 Tax=Tegillarca granosa TaxID=220873 RepID=A0ABQ9F5K1_TEGGR|nr:hypothetical protein KUTeg_012723 [Tegillarca granosa]